MHEKFNAQFVFTGDRLDSPVYEKLLSLCNKQKKISVLNLCGLVNLRECYSLYRGLNLALSVDSGNAHIAACAGIPTYVLYGPTSFKRWLPVGKNVFPVVLSQKLPCQPCDLKISCSHLSCMKLLTPDFAARSLTL